MDGLFPTFESQAPAPGSYRSLPSFRLHLLAGLSARRVELRLMERFDLRLPEARVIGLVGTFGALSLKEICREGDIEKSHASKLIARLAQRGWVEKLGDAQDQRAISVRLTPAGLALHKQLYEDLLAHNTQWLTVLDESERSALLRTLEKLIRHSREGVSAERLSGVAQDEAATGAASPQEPASIHLDLSFARELHQTLGALLAQQGESAGLHQEGKK